MEDILTLAGFALVIGVIIAIFRQLCDHKTSQSLIGYQKRNRIMNRSEQAFFVNLQRSVGDEFIILSKVRIEDFVAVSAYGIPPQRQWSLRGRIKSRHVDFLICDKGTTEPILAIELDGVYHHKPAQINRDNFINSLYETIGLPIIHIRIGSDFEKEAGRIRDVLVPKDEVQNFP